MPDLPPQVKVPDVPPIRHDKVRLIILLYRKQGMSQEDFSTYWRETHSGVFASLTIVKRNLLKYEQIHANPDAVKAAQDAGFATTDWDGLAVFDAVSMEKIMEIFGDPEYKEKVIPDEQNFIDHKKALAFPAQIVSVLNDPS